MMTMWRQPRRWWFWPRQIALVIAAQLLIALFLLALPIMVPIAALQAARIDRRKRALVETWACGWCVAPLGPEALARADALFGAQVTKISPEHGMLSLVRELDACCARCGAAHRFDKASNRFVLLPVKMFAKYFGDMVDTAVEPASIAMAWPWLPPRNADHEVMLTRDSVCLADDVDAPHHGTMTVPRDVDVAAIGEALLRSPWLAHVGSTATWRCAAGTVEIVFGLRAGVPFVRKTGDEFVPATAVSALRLRYKGQLSR